MEKDITKKDVFLYNWENKLGYPLSYKDFDEFENIINYYENKLKKKQEIIEKAIEYTNKNIKDDYYCRKSNYLINNLLSILEDKEV